MTPEETQAATITAQANAQAAVIDATRHASAMKVQLDTALAQAAEYQKQLGLIEQEKASALATAQAETERFKLQAGRERLRNEAIRAGIVNPSLVDHLPATALKVDAAGAVTGIEETLALWKANTPEIFRNAVTPAPGAVVTPEQPPMGAVRIPSAGAANPQGSALPAPVDALTLPATRAGRAEFAKLKAEALAESHRIAGSYSSRQ